MSIETTASILQVLSQGFQELRNINKLTKLEKEKVNLAVETVMNAAVATKAYLYDSKELGNPSRHREEELSNLWQHAAAAIQNHDEHLFQASQVKSLGWADPREWAKHTDKAVTVNLNKIIEQCEHLRAKYK